MNRFDPLPAIIELENAKYVADTNHPINLKEGSKEQAALEKTNAASYTKAIELLKNSPTMRKLKHK